MKTKTINTILCKKFDEFAASITDEAVRTLVNSNSIITGGSIASQLLKETVNDFDIYFRNKETAFAVADYYAKKYVEANPQWSVKAVSKPDGRVTFSIWNSKNVSVVGQVPEESEQNTDPSTSDRAFQEADDTPAETLDSAEGEKTQRVQYKPMFLSSNAITLSSKVQLIIRFYGDPQEIHENYDFVHATNYWTSWEREVTLRPEALEALLTRELRYVGSKYPICSLIRTRKFLGRGWTINAGQYLKMAWQVSELDLTNLEVLKEQLVGVDSAYFSMMVADLKKKDAGSVDGGYLMTLVDKLF